MDDDTRRFRRRLDDQPLRWWATRLVWFVAGVVCGLAYSGIGMWLAGHLHRVPK